MPTSLPRSRASLSLPRPGLAVLGSLFMLVLLGLVACGSSTDPAGASSDGDGPGYTIVTTTGMVTDIARRVAGDHARVVGLISSGVDPHLYQPTRDDIRKLMSGDIVFYSGLHLEGKMTEAIERIGDSATVVAVTESIDPDTLLTPEAFKGFPDPHVWMDPLSWAQAVEVVRRTLSEYDPTHINAYNANAAALIDEINALNGYAAGCIGSIPESSRVLVTAHDAFSYFGRRYHMEVVGIQGISTQSEAGVRDIERIVDMIVTRKIGAVFIETTVSERNIKALIAGAAARGQTVTIGGSLFSDAMGLAGTYEGTYIGMIDHNVTIITRALGGDAPERGMNGKLRPQP